MGLEGFLGSRCRPVVYARDPVREKSGGWRKMTAGSRGRAHYCPVKQKRVPPVVSLLLDVVDLAVV